MSDSRGMHKVHFTKLDVEICEDAIVQAWMSGSGNRSEASEGGLLMHPGPGLSTTQGLICWREDFLFLFWFLKSSDFAKKISL